MKKKFWFITQVFFLGGALVTLGLTLAKLSGKSNPLTRFDHKPPVYNNREAYDPSLIRLNSQAKLESYCDSIYAAVSANNSSNDFDSMYVDIVSNVVRNRFYHGYSYFGFDNNYVAYLASRVTVDGWGVPVLPNDVLQYPYAACSQQAVVMMKALEDKGISTRKISFYGQHYGGHFAFEVYYDGAWHFHDPNMEPSKDVLNEYGRPGIAFLVSHPDILCRAYSHRQKAEVLDIFPTYAYGPVNKFPAPRAAVFQRVTGFLSNTLWAFLFVGFFFARWQYRRITSPGGARRKKIAQFPSMSEPVLGYQEYASRAS
jgi:hypothetical protein